MSGKRVTMQQVADLAGVSRTTVSFVLNNTPNVSISPETRRKVLEAARKLNYVPDSKAVTLATGRTKTLALVLRQTPHQLSMDAFLGEVLRGLTQAVEPEGYHILVYPLAPDMTYGGLVRSQKVDGLILSGPTVNDPELGSLLEEGTPIVLQGTAGLNGVPSVDVDNVASAKLAVEHLIELGHRRIGHITNAPLDYTAARDRLAGYRLAMENAGLEFDEELIREAAYTDESGYDAMVSLLNMPEPPTAVFVGSDVVALGALQAIHDRKLHIPGDISVVGFDDIPLTRYLDPGLTTIHLPAFELGYHAGEMLLTLLRGDELPQMRVTLETRLIIRASTGPPPGR